MPERQKFIARPLFIQVRDELASQIVAGTWKPGVLLPNEVLLAKEFGVSQGTMRKALDLLERERIVIRQQGRGTTVVDHDTEEMAIKFSSIYNDFDQRISGHISTCASELGVANDFERQRLGITAKEQVLRGRRIRSYHDHPFMYEEITLVAGLFPGIDKSQLNYVRLTSIAQKHGVVLMLAKERVYPIICPEDRLNDLALDAPVPILFLERTTFSDADVAVEFRRGWCHLRDKHYMSITS